MRLRLAPRFLLKMLILCITRGRHDVSGLEVLTIPLIIPLVLPLLHDLFWIPNDGDALVLIQLGTVLLRIAACAVGPMSVMLTHFVGGTLLTPFAGFGAGGGGGAGAGGAGAGGDDGDDGGGTFVPCADVSCLWLLPALSILAKSSSDAYFLSKLYL